MTKAGIHSLTQHLAMENAVSPAVVKIPIYEGFNEFHPIGRVGKSEDVANTIAFLLC